MSSNVEAMLRDGISACKAGRKEEARDLLLRVVEIDEQNEMAWLWLSGVLDTLDDQITCLENVLAINPNNEKASKGLEMLRRKATSSPSSTKSSSSQDDAFANVSFTPSSSPLSSPIEEEEFPTSVEWAAPPTETSSASSQRVVEEPSAKEYDDWLARLNIGRKDVEEELPDTDFAASLSKTFGYDEEEDDDILTSISPALSNSGTLPASVVSSLGLDDFDLEEDDNLLPSLASSPSVARGLISPGRETPNEDRDDDFLNAELDDLEDDEDTIEEIEAGEFFRYIPDDIKATRLPGTNERYPILVILLFILLVIANIGAAVMLTMKM